jgi:DNA-binding MarR family transcriptional regulator
LKKIFEHPIISAVVAGLILYIATQVDGFWSSVWKFLSSVLLKTLNILQTEVSIPLWVVLLASILLILGLIKFLLFVTKKPKNRDLNSEEISLLELIVIKDGQALDYNEITSKLKVKKLIAEQIVEALSELELIETYENNFDGSQIYLTEKGRDYILGNKFKST